MSQLSIGIQAPDFELNDLEGRPHRLSDALAHGPVVLVFYKSDCPTCELAFPHLQKIFARAGKTAGWTFWGISEDEPDETRRFGQQHGVTFDLLIDEHPYDVSSAYGLLFVPGIFLIRSDGRILVSEVGFTKAGLNEIAGFEVFSPNDGLPAFRAGCRSKN